MQIEQRSETGALPCSCRTFCSRQQARPPPQKGHYGSRAFVSFFSDFPLKLGRPSTCLTEIRRTWLKKYLAHGGGDDNDDDDNDGDDDDNGDDDDDGDNDDDDDDDSLGPRQAIFS